MEISFSLSSDIIISKSLEKPSNIYRFRATSCKSQQEKITKQEKNNSTRKGILHLKMCFLVELFFLVDFYMKRPLIPILNFGYGYLYYMQSTMFIHTAHDTMYIYLDKMMTDVSCQITQQQSQSRISVVVLKDTDIIQDQTDDVGGGRQIV